MNLSALLTPWLALAAVLILLIYVEKWIHSHLYGVGWVLTNNKKSATALYYVLLFPGVFVHEFTQYLVAGALNVRIKRVLAWPEAQEDGTLRLNFVQIQEAMWFQAAIIGAAPLFAGLSLIWLISNHILNLENVLQALTTADITVIGPALQEVGSTPDFYLWLYLMFAISNAMLPTPADREGWPLVLLLFACIVVFLVVIGVGEVLLETFTGPVAHGVELLTTAFVTVLMVEIPSIVVISASEELLERLMHRKFEYSQRPSRETTRQPGSSAPLPPDAPLPSIYNLHLPIPVPTDEATRLSAERPGRAPRKAASVTAKPPPAGRPAPDRSPSPPVRRTPSPPATTSPGRALTPARPVDRSPADRSARTSSSPATADRLIRLSQSPDERNRRPKTGQSAPPLQRTGTGLDPQRRDAAPHPRDQEVERDQPRPIDRRTPFTRTPQQTEPPDDTALEDEELQYSEFDPEDGVLDNLYDPE